MKKRPVRIAIAGAGRRSIVLPNYVENHPEQAVIRGVFDTIPELAHNLVRHASLNDAVVYPSLKALVEDAEVDAVFVSTPDDQHVEPVCAALEAGKHVYGEKPLALTLADADRIIDAARHAKGLFYLGKNLRHAPVFEAIHQAIAEGKLGKILTIETNEHYFGGRSYFRRWNRHREKSGGLWITKACHDFDLLNWLAGSPPRRVFATASLGYFRERPEAGTHCRQCPVSESCPDRYESSNVAFIDELSTLVEQTTGKPYDRCLFNAKKDTFDNGMAVIDYANGVRACYTVNVVSSITCRRMTVSGTGGVMTGDMMAGKLTFTPRLTGREEIIDLSSAMHGSHGGADQKILDDFFDCCCSGRPPRSSAEDGRLSLAVGLAATRSSDTGCPVEL